MGRVAKYLGLGLVTAILIAMTGLPGFARTSAMLRPLVASDAGALGVPLHSIQPLTVQAERAEPRLGDRPANHDLGGPLGLVPRRQPTAVYALRDISLLAPDPPDLRLLDSRLLDSGHRKSQLIAQKDQRQMEAERLLEQGNAQYSRGQYRQALALWQQALVLYRAITFPAGEALTLNNMGIVHQVLGDYAVALDHFQQSLDIARAVGNRSIEASTLNNMGIVHQALGDYAVALDHYQQSVVISREIDDLATVARTLNNLGEVNRLLGNYPVALDHFQQSLDIARDIDDHQLNARTLNNLGAVHQALGEYPVALDYFQQSLAIAREIGALAIVAMTLNNRGAVYQALAEYPVALDYFQQSLAISRDIGDLATVSLGLNNLGVINQGLGEYAVARDYFQQSLAIARDIGDRLGEARTLHNLGEVSRLLGQYSVALDYFEQSLAISRDLGSRAAAARTLNNLGNVNEALGNYPVALDYFQQSLAIAREIGDQDIEGLTLNNIGVGNEALGNYPVALDYFQQSLAIAREIGSRAREVQALNNMGEVNRVLGNYPVALDYFEQSLAIAREIGDRAMAAQTLNNIGSVNYLLAESAVALDYYQQSLAIARDIGDLAAAADTLNNMGALLVNTNRFSEAEEMLGQAIATYESLRSDLTDTQLIAIADAQSRTYTNLETALIAQDKVSEALVTTERGRAQAFALQLALRQDNRAEAPVTIPAISDIQRIAREQNATLVSYSLVFSSSLYIWVVSPAGEIQFRAVAFNGDGAAGQSLAVNPIAAIDGPVVRGDGSFADVDPSEVDQLVADTRAGIGVVGGLPPRRLQSLHQVLIDPIVDLLPTDPEANVVFIPQGSLFLVPFAALQDGDGTYLIAKHTLTTAPSIQVLGLASEAIEATASPTAAHGFDYLSQQALVVGNPAMPSLPAIQLVPLPGAEREAMEISNILNVVPLLGDQATETQVKQQLPTASLIHLATHGLLTYRHTPFEIPGAIALTPGGDEDGLLTASELLEMDLQAQLAILSACDTGRGEITGDGVVGLSRALMTAGVPSVVVSLWAVPDAPTALLMTEVYRQLSQGQTKAQALRQAMLMTMEHHPDPRSWAAFTLIGVNV